MLIYVNFAWYPETAGDAGKRSELRPVRLMQRLDGESRMLLTVMLMDVYLVLVSLKAEAG